MKAEKWSAVFQAMALSFLLSFGAVGCAVTGLELNVTDMGRTALLCACAACVTGLLSRVPFGGWLVSALILGGAVGIWRIDAWQAQMVDMLCRISGYYHNAYGWAVIASPLQGDGLMDWPVGCFALWIAAANCWNLSKGVGNHTGVLAAVLPLAASVVVIDTVPGSLYLYLWLLGLVLTLLSGGLRRQDLRWGVYLVRLAAVPAALALGLLFWAVPKEGYDKHPDELQQKIVDWFQELPEMWNQVRDEVASGLDGAVQSRSVSLDTLGPRIKRVYPVMEVTAPVSGTVYLRGQHYDTYTGEGWTVADGAQELFEAPDNTQELGRITITTRRTRDITYLPYYPDEAINLFGGCVDNTQNEKTYSWTMRGLGTQWRSLVAAMDSYDIALRQRQNADPANLELPSDTHAWASGVVDTILYGETTATEVADAIAAYVRSSARYDLDTGRMRTDAEDFARWFLEESDTGYCVHFATAATVLLRAAGVEARYVEGYMFTAQMGEQTTVTADQAHAWAEYYEPLLDAWIVLEATPADLGEEETAAEPETQPPAPTETEPELTQPPGSLPETTGSREDAPMIPQEGQDSSAPVDLRWLWNMLSCILIIGAAVFTLEGQRRLRLGHRQRRFARGSRRRQALEQYRELERLCRLLKREIPEEATDLAEKAKYSRRGVEMEELEALETLLESALAELKQGSWYRKILYKYIFAAY